MRPGQGPAVSPGLEPLEPAMRSVGDVTNGVVSTGGLFGETGGVGVAFSLLVPGELLCVSRAGGPLSSRGLGCVDQQLALSLWAPASSRSSSWLVCLASVILSARCALCVSQCVPWSEARWVTLAFPRLGGNPETVGCVYAGGTRSFLVTQPVEEAAAFSAVGLSPRTPRPSAKQAWSSQEDP